MNFLLIMILQYLEKMQLLYDGKAKEAKVNIVGACGWDSIPADMGTTFTRDNFEGDLNSVESYVSVKPGPEVCCASTLHICQTGM